MLEKKFKIKVDSVKKANQKLIDDAKFKKENPLLYQIKKYFEKPPRCKFQIGEKNEKSKPNFYTDILGYKRTIIKLSREDINNYWKKAVENYDRENPQ